jgi:putative spermidine/putrescine transport system ATP-binding protein
MTGKQAIVRFSGVRKSYDGRTLVVRDLNLDIARGEFLTLLGPSGSGKTTTLMMLAGFETPTEGRIELDGGDITRVPAHQRGIGMVFQNYALFPHMTVAENVAYPLKVRKVPAAEIMPRVERALAMVRLGGFGARRPAQLSGGQQQRVAFARALVFNPKLVLLDEPLGALDKQLREEMQMELKQIHEDLGVTMVYVTHDQSEALTMSDRVAVFNEGRIQQLADAVELYERPSNPFVAQFVGENNLIDGEVRGLEGESVVLRSADGVVLRARRTADLAVGDGVSICLRPERVCIDREVSGKGVLGTVEKLVYLGDVTRLLVRVGASTVISAKTTNGGAGQQFSRGERVRLTWQEDDAQTFRRVA